MNAPLLPQHPRRGAVRRGLCLALGALFVLAALAGTADRPGDTAHHRTHALSAAALGYDLQAASHRSGLDAAPVERAAARTSGPHRATDAGAVAELHGQAPDTVRTRGPPAPA